MLSKNVHYSIVISEVIKSVGFCRTSFNCDLKYVLKSKTNQKSPINSNSPVLEALL